MYPTLVSQTPNIESETLNIINTVLHFKNEEFLSRCLPAFHNDQENICLFSSMEPEQAGDWIVLAPPASGVWKVF